jgi:hypothetical protein
LENLSPGWISLTKDPLTILLLNYYTETFLIKPLLENTVKAELGETQLSPGTPEQDFPRLKPDQYS